MHGRSRRTQWLLFKNYWRYYPCAFRSIKFERAFWLQSGPPMPWAVSFEIPLQDLGGNLLLFSDGGLGECVTGLICAEMDLIQHCPTLDCFEMQVGVKRWNQTSCIYDYIIYYILYAVKGIRAFWSSFQSLSPWSNSKAFRFDEWLGWHHPQPVWIGVRNSNSSWLMRDIWMM